MEFIVNKTPFLEGSVSVDGAKNAALPILAATMLCEEECTLHGIPKLSDVSKMNELLRYIGCDVRHKVKTVTVKSAPKLNAHAPYELVSAFRASFLVAAPILARQGYAKICLPGGCAIGSRPIDLHLKGFAALGAKVFSRSGFVELSAHKLTGAKIYLDFPSVGATENLMMAAALASGKSIIENAATEPEITDLANFINAMGGDVRGAGTDTITIAGVKRLHGAEHTVIPDRIEAGTFMTAVCMTGGKVIVKNVIPIHIKPVTAKLREAGAEIKEYGDSVQVTASRPINPMDIKTLPFPGFPTDMQAQFMALAAVTGGTSIITETIFENRFMHAGELVRMGANIKINGRTAVIEGVKKLSAAKVRATDLRAGAALIIAGLAAEGQTIIEDEGHIDRGYDNIEKKLKKLGANIERTL
ncbi:MAG: UDP-N-acetylglucosamine 1-carboxyvinyltransferase [Clostridia bacterium]|nr:UDP-N-acetylglucosamine 1-carboxyvinyltransferase [Clostridia bacterium]